MSTPATTSPLATTIQPAAATPAASNVIDFFQAPVTTGDAHDVQLLLASGVSRAMLGLEPIPTKENATPAEPGGTAGTAAASVAAANNDMAAAGAGEGSAAGQADGKAGERKAETGKLTAVQKIVAERVTALGTELAELKGEPEADTTVGRAVKARITAIEGELAELGTAPGAKDAKGAGDAAEVPAIEIPALTAPIAGRPLALVRDERGLGFLQATAKSVKSWARQNSEGGEMPADLRANMEKANQLITGNKDSKLNVSEDFLDAKTVGHFLGLAEDMLDERIPQQQQFLAAEATTHAAVAKESPAFFDVKKPEGQLVQRILTIYPWIRQVPEWPGLVRDLATGFLQNRKADGTTKSAADAKGEEGKTAAPKVTNTEGKVVPLAPSAPLGGSGGSPVAPTQTALDEAMKRAEQGKASDDDWKLLTEYAA